MNGKSLKRIKQSWTTLLILTVQLFKFDEQLLQLDMRVLHLLRLDRLKNLCTPLEQSDQLIFREHPGWKTTRGLQLKCTGAPLQWLTSHFVNLWNSIVWHEWFFRHLPKYVVIWWYNVEMKVDKV